MKERLLFSCLSGGRPRRLSARSPGFTLVELMVALVIFLLIVLAMTGVARYGAVAKVRANDQVAAARMTETFNTALLHLNFYDLFPFDSNNKAPVYGAWNPALGPSHANYPAQRRKAWAGSGAQAALVSFEKAIKEQGFTRFTIDVQYVRRDSADSNADWWIADAIPFKDENAPYGEDDFDGQVKFFDQNNDGDYWDTWVDNGVVRSEAPDTHAKVVQLSVWKGDRPVVVGQGSLLTAEQMTGKRVRTAENPLKFVVEDPFNGAYFYRKKTPPQIAAQDLTITKGHLYSDPVLGRGRKLARVDEDVPVVFEGLTEPNAEAQFVLFDMSHFQRSPLSAPSDAGAADGVGGFRVSSPRLTAEMAGVGEEWFPVYGRAHKDGQYSPWGARSYMRDVTPPVFRSTWPAPGAALATRQPFTGVLFDDTPSVGPNASGLYAEVVHLESNGQPVTHRNVPVGKWKNRLYMVDPVTGLPPELLPGVYTALVEAGDLSGYKVKHAWSFTVLPLGALDTSPPDIAIEPVAGGVKVSFRDAESGVRLSTVKVRVDNQDKVTAANLLDAAVPDDTDPTAFHVLIPLPAGTHRVEAEASHFATQPPNAVIEPNVTVAP